jgi:hypothetical protein
MYVCMSRQTKPENIRKCLCVLDVKPPSFTTCPSNRKFSYNTTFRTNTARVEWEVPQYEDNSILHDVNHKVTLVEVNGYKSPRDFEIGTHRAHYILTDKAGLQAHCEFVIEVNGMWYL